EPRPGRRLRRLDDRRGPGGARLGHRLRRRAALGRADAVAAGGAADVRADPVLPDAGAALLHPRRHADHGRQAGRGAAALLRRDHAAAARRRALHNGGRLGGVRRRVRERGGQRQRARLRADPLAEAPGLPGGAVRGEQRDLRRDRHPDPALDPDDPLRCGQRRLHRRPVHGRRAARHPHGGGLRGRLLVAGAAPRHGRGRDPARPAPPRPARGAGLAGAGPAGVDPGRAALRLRHADRDRGDGGALRAPHGPVPLPRHVLGPLPQGDDRRGHRHRHRHDGHHGQRGGELDPHLRPGAAALRRVGLHHPARALAGDPGDEPDHAGDRRPARPGARHPAAGADLRAAGAADRDGPAAARAGDGAQPGHRALHAAGGHHAVHLDHHRRQHDGRDHEGALAVLRGGDRPAAGGELHTGTDDPVL
ncbi:MAG: TRAP-type C4-dicarboxylate transport system, large permease component, partial [uncultured Acetobacteraceae bacterium]